MNPSTLNDYKQRLLRVLDHIQAHLDEPLVLEELARIACLSPYHFHRLFSGMVGESVAGLIRRIRLERAATSLQTQPRSSIIDTALTAGYQSHEAFSRAFAQAFGHSPSAHRRLSTLRHKIPCRSGIHFTPDSHAAHFRTRPLHPSIMNTTIKTRPPTRVASLRHVGPYHQVGSTWERLLDLLGPEGHLGPGTQYIGIAYDDPEVIPPEKLRCDTCVTVDADFEPFSDLIVREIRGGEYAVTTHEGPYEKITGTYRHLLGQWLPRSGRELADAPCIELYLNDPTTTEPAELLTDVCAPLTPNSVSA